ncbi:hypothetical protein DY120_00235 [Apilactobacillus micheneri]|uniref:Extracellular protein n=1 Tax=Apilactobacillus micheneri TaxID=1899430 RepID=A0ABY2YYW7_9LACO|nr:hypothetical protein [Apilactobacillus micheneri]TPR26161.1 hypothetical protein DY114_00235 [Apilactobacillus micheneri]TPR26915.1 hypothetical protein DY111_00235 [Apilactobacillus micheneri]TPR27773.1 hypothetical protein DY113_04010 [Apilactobacillus micheneri]TPR31678.1 hypothetical protein DY117_00235 [Apilactobacillus micheneri]TPR32082.1 hypothetical protein DY120_00235 [Apilactobacillus micheneri]
MKKLAKIALTAVAALSISGMAAPMASVHADSNFFVHNWDEPKNSIPSTDQDNAMQNYNDNDLQIMRNKLPKFKPVWGHYKHVRNTNEFHTYEETNNDNSMITKWYLPTGFNVSPQEHGNYQGIVMANNSIYLLESMGTGANQGAIIRFKLDALEKMGLMDNGNQNLLLDIFSYFNPYTDQGRKNNQDFVNYINATADARSDMKKSSAQLQKAQTEITNGKDIISKSAMNYRKVSTDFKKKFAKQIKKYLAKDKDNSKQSDRNDRKPDNKKPTNKISTNPKDYLAKSIKFNKLSKSEQRKVKKLVAARVQVKQTFHEYKQLRDKTYQQIDKSKAKVDTLKQKINDDQNQINQAQNGNTLLGQYEAVTDSVEASPLINIGHGQTMSYNPANNHLYLAQDDKLGDFSNDDKNQITELDANTLQPVHQYSFKLMHNGKNLGLHTLAFDKQGRAYIGVHSGPNGVKKAYSLYIGSLNNDKVSFRPAKQVIHWAGSWNQNLTYNPVTDRIYMVSNDMVTSVPVDKLNAGTLTKKDVHYNAFNSHREWEGLTFDGEGHAYALMLWRGEILRSDYVLN